MNNLLQGDNNWSTWKVILVWKIDTRSHQLMLTLNWEAKVRAALGTITFGAHQVSL